MDDKDKDVKKIRKAVVDQVHLVTKPAINQRFCLVKSAEPEADKDPETPVVDLKKSLEDALAACLKDEAVPADDIRAILKKSPVLANDAISQTPVDNDLGRQECIDNVRMLVQKSERLPVDLRKSVVAIAKFHGVEAPEVELSSSSEMAPVMAKLEAMTNVLQQCVVAMASAPPTTAASTKVKKEDDPEAKVALKAPVALVKSVEGDSRALQAVESQLAELKRSLLRATGKDPDGDR